MATAPTPGLPRIAHGNGPRPTHVHYIFHEPDGRYRIEICEGKGLRSRLGFHRSLICKDRAEFDAQMEILLAARIPFMIGHVIPGPSDDAYYWLEGKGRPIDYIEIAMGGKTEWSLREITADAKEWRGVKPEELLAPEIDLFDPAHRPHLAPPPPEPPPPAPEPAPPAAPIAVEAPASPAAETAPQPEPPTAPPSPPIPEPEPEAAAPPPAKEAPPLTRRPPRDSKRWIDYSAALIPLLILGNSFSRATDYFRFVMPTDPLDILPLAMQLALAVGTAYAGFWFLVFPRAFPRWHDRLTVLAYAFVIGILIAMIELMIANIRHDDAPRIAVPTTVIDKSIYKGKSGRYPPEHWTWHLRVSAWSADSGEEHLRVSRETWESVRPGSEIVFHPHPGWLGWLWYSEAELEEAGFVEVRRQ